MLVYYPVVKGICIFTGNDIAFTVFLPFAIYCHFLIIRSHNFAFSFERVYIISFVSVAVTASCTCCTCCKIVMVTFAPIFCFVNIFVIWFCPCHTACKRYSAILQPPYCNLVANFELCTVAHFLHFCIYYISHFFIVNHYGICGMMRLIVSVNSFKIIFGSGIAQCLGKFVYLPHFCRFIKNFPCFALYHPVFAYNTPCIAIRRIADKFFAAHKLTKFGCRLLKWYTFVICILIYYLCNLAVTHSTHMFSKLFFIHAMFVCYFFKCNCVP